MLLRVAQASCCHQLFYELGSTNRRKQNGQGGIVLVVYGVSDRGSTSPVPVGVAVRTKIGRCASAVESPRDSGVIELLYNLQVESLERGNWRRR